MSEYSLHTFLEKCIMPYAETTRILFVGFFLRHNSLARKIDNCIENMKKRFGKKEISIQMLNIVREDYIFSNSINDPFSFE